MVQVSLCDPRYRPSNSNIVSNSTEVTISSSISTNALLNQVTLTSVDCREVERLQLNLTRTRSSSCHNELLGKTKFLGLEVGWKVNSLSVETNTLENLAS